VYIATIGGSLIAERMKVAQMLWSNNFSAEYAHQDNPTLKKQMSEVLERNIPYMVVFGSDELQKGVVKLKDMRKHTEVEVPREALVDTLVQLGCAAVGAAGSDVEFLRLLKGSSVRAAEEPAPPAPPAASDA
jgi:histidyl-tRNA synthetase